MRILIVEDDRDFLELLKEYLSEAGFNVEACSLGKEAVKLLRDKDFALVLLDLFLPDMNGMEILKHIKDSSKLTEVVVITGHGTIKTAVEAMKEGASDFLTKPCSLEEIEITLRKCLEARDYKRDSLLLSRKGKLASYSEFVFESSLMKGILERINKISCADCPVLVTGETGVGKEVIAGIIHRLSDRVDKPFVALNVASIPKELVESELFGYEKGAFSGADRSKEGFFELAHGGTLFLDEIGELELSLQAKLLRAIESKRFYRLGGRKEIESDVRVIAATNRDIRELVKEGRFREDLYFRLNVVEIEIPPLRYRKEDILPLAHHFLKVFSRKYGKEVKGFTAEAEKLLLNYSWRGNVRELRNLVERSVLFAEGELIGASDISCLIPDEEESSGKLEDIEKEYILKVLRQVQFNKKKASEILGIPLRTLYRKLEAYGIK